MERNNIQDRVRGAAVRTAPYARLQIAYQFLPDEMARHLTSIVIRQELSAPASCEACFAIDGDSPEIPIGAACSVLVDDEPRPEQSRTRSRAPGHPQQVASIQHGTVHAPTLLS